jgi:acetoin:2,6-dichlorophenolindophenol oxidoreductase subunit beta
MPWARIPISQSKVDGDRILPFAAAVREATDQAMVLDPNVFAIGLDSDDKFGVFGSMLNMTHPERILGAPIAENATTGMAVGAALSGMRPINIHLRVDFLMLAMDQIVNYMSKWRYKTQGRVKLPIVVRAIIGRGWGSGSQHSGTMQGLFTHLPGLKVVMPSTPFNAKGLLLSAIQDDYPVIFIEHRWLYRNSGHVPQEMYRIPLGNGNLVRTGSKATVVATSIAAVDVANVCEAEGLDVDVIDPQTLKPLDETMILESVRKTGRLLVVDYDFPMNGFAAEVCALAAEKAFGSLKAPVARLMFPECPMPASGVLEKVYYPTAQIGASIRNLLNAR